MITVYGEILQETDMAILVRCDEDADGAWLPKSQIKYEGERGDCCVEIEIPEFLADEKDFFDGSPYSATEPGMDDGANEPPTEAGQPQEEA